MEFERITSTLFAPRAGGKFFEDFTLNQRIEHPLRRTLTEGDAALYLALTGDRNPLFCDRTFAQSLGYDREPINDVLVFHLVFGQTVAEISRNAVANLGYAEVLFLRPVFAGDTLRAESRVVGIKQNRSGENGNVYVHTRGINQQDQTVIKFYRWVMVRKDNADAPPPPPAVPELPAEVSIKALQIGSALATSGTHFPGGLFFEDYAIGETIYHGPGMTVEEAEHAMATRLYQNSAMVHFDGHAMASRPPGKRLVYGGHVISLACGMAFNGLENALRTLAWNCGTHANPTYAGDTLYAYTQVVDKAQIHQRPDVGALRLRTFAVKNRNPEREPVNVKTRDDAKGRDLYHPDIVLELDYFVAMPRRTR